MSEDFMSDRPEFYNVHNDGDHNKNFTGGIHNHYPKTPIARPILNQKGTETFVGREDDLVKLHGLLEGESRVAIAAATAGMGGVGKTELAVQYAVRHDGDYPGGIWWLSGRDIVGQMLSYGVAMGLPETGPSSSDVQKVQECYTTNGYRLSFRSK
jgi:hypothetical protein